MEHFGQVMERPLTPHGIDFVFVGSKSLIHLNILGERDPTRTCHFQSLVYANYGIPGFFFFTSRFKGGHVTLSARGIGTGQRRYVGRFTSRVLQLCVG